VNRLGDRLVASAHAPDGVVEAIEDPESPFYLGVQWHAEYDTERATGISLLRALIDAAADRVTA
jgi:putative glutamine amidotransferase